MWKQTLKWMLLVMFSVLPGFAESGDAGLSAKNKYFRFEVIKSVSAHELALSGERVVLSGESGSVILYFPVDSESAPRKGNWTEDGIVILAQPDDVVKEIGIRLWTSRQADLLIAESKQVSKGDRVSAIFSTRVNECGGGKDCTAERFEVSLKGNRAYANGTLLTSLH